MFKKKKEEPKKKFKINVYQNPKDKNWYAWEVHLDGRLLRNGCNSSAQLAVWNAEQFCDDHKFAGVRYYEA